MSSADFLTMSKYRVTTVQEIKDIELLASKGLTDSEIAKKVGVSVGIAAKYSTRFWELKMKNKVNE